jgi:hypothetical protein
MTVEERPARLERENGRLKRVLFVMGLLFISGLLMTQTAASIRRVWESGLGPAVRAWSEHATWRRWLSAVYG